MSDQHLKLPSALKHGVYSAADILPGESRAEFEKWHRQIIAELQPTGPLEEQAEGGKSGLKRIPQAPQAQSLLH